MLRPFNVERIVISTDGAGKTGYPHKKRKKKRMKLDPYLIPYTKSDSKGMKDPNMRAESIKLLKQEKSFMPLDLATIS